MIRVVLPVHLRTLANVRGEVEVELATPASLAAVLDALETRFPTLRGTIRDPATGARRPFVRFYACGEDLSHDPTDRPLPAPITAGTEPLLVVGAMSGG